MFVVDGCPVSVFALAYKTEVDRLSTVKKTQKNQKKPKTKKTKNKKRNPDSYGLVVKKTFGPIDVYRKTAFSLDLFKHFPDVYGLIHSY